MSRSGVARSALKLLSCFLLQFVVACGGGDDDCIECGLSGSATECPSINKQCSFGTITVQQCSGGADSSTGCCATKESEISCQQFALLSADQQYDLVDGMIRFRSVESGELLCTAIDPVASGWIEETMSRPEQESLIVARMADIAQTAELISRGTDRIPRNSHGPTPLDPGDSW